MRKIKKEQKLNFVEYLFYFGVILFLLGVIYLV